MVKAGQRENSTNGEESGVYWPKMTSEGSRADALRRSYVVADKLYACKTEVYLPMCVASSP